MGGGLFPLGVFGWFLIQYFRGVLLEERYFNFTLLLSYFFGLF